MTFPNPRPTLSASILQSLSNALADMNSHAEIRNLLLGCGIPDVSPGIAKPKRLYNAFVSWQNESQCSNLILAYIQTRLKPELHLDRKIEFEKNLSKINQILSFAGWELTDYNKYRNIQKSETITQAEQRAKGLKVILEQRKTHEYIFQYCKPELLVDNYFHSVFEATKSVADRIREMTQLNMDGISLVEKAFAKELPLITINNYITETDKSEHSGLANLIKGMFGLMRNPTAHEPKLKFVINEEDALDRLDTISFIHKLLDRTNNGI
jgi:uncharacterized protein (TIGR02391 family)